MNVVRNIRNIHGYTFNREDPYQNGARFVFNSGMNFASWGETIYITVLPVGPRSTSIEVRSECALPTQIIDYGKNASNVRDIFKQIGFANIKL